MGKLTKEQRVAYIDTARRSQPVEELERKAKKANRRGWRRVYAGMEGRDLTFAKDWRWRRAYFADAKQPTHFCEQCHQFGQLPFIKEEGRYSGPIIHKPNCAYAPDNGPYPGWIAAGRAALKEASDGK